VKPWVRIQRLVRDIPTKSIEAGYHGISNLRQIIQNKMTARGLKCHCIRCMEIKDNKCINKARLVVRKYTASEAQEYHITFEIHNSSLIQLIRYYMLMFFSWFVFIFSGYNIYWNGNMQSYQYLLGFCRLRLDPEAGANLIPELKNSALIREVHVYGKSLGIVGNKDNKTKTQHKGYGQQLVSTAEKIAFQNGYRKVAIIAGVGTREYYSKKCGYHLEGTYMVKDL
jgi:elongator complex protein 3